MEGDLPMEFFDHLKKWLDGYCVTGVSEEYHYVAMVSHRQFTFLKRGVVVTDRKPVTRRRKRRMRMKYRRK